MITRKVRFPLKVKLLTLMIVLIASSLIFFVGIALKIFKDDKSAYIFESMLVKANSEQTILSQKIRSLTSSSLTVVNKKILAGQTDLSSLLKSELEKDSAYSLKVIIPVQGELYQWKDNEVSVLNSEEKNFLRPLFKKGVNEGVKEMKELQELYSYHYDPEMNFAYVVSLPLSEAYAASTFLINKSLYYGLFILGIAMTLSVLLARPLTAQLESLFGFTQELAKGNFKQTLKLDAHDEVGALSDSINDMAGKIVVFMDEMKEKARLENEIAVAQLVQSSFFPEKNFVKGIAGHFEPATECGGDWWGFTDHGDWRTVFIADATGHGVPAALLTATMNCCKSSLSFLSETRPEILSRPHEILRYMNYAVSEAGREIQVTCFIASLNLKTNKLVYSNASHTPPILYSDVKGDFTKDSFRPLIDSNGPRLGQDKNATYSSSTLSLAPRDTIFFYTDGLTEAENNEGARWGERRLIKALTTHGRGTPDEVIQEILKEMKSFASGRVNGDDITAVAMKVFS